jgi:hypothetical protein
LNSTHAEAFFHPSSAFEEEFEDHETECPARHFVNYGQDDRIWPDFFRALEATFLDASESRKMNIGRVYAIRFNFATTWKKRISSQ